jgi:antitoxin component of MazEF toxin-antitoxin module
MISLGIKKVHNLGNSKGLVIPSSILKGLKTGTFELILTDENNILLVPQFENQEDK